MLAAELLASNNPTEQAPAAVEGAAALSDLNAILKYGSGYRTVSLDSSIYVHHDEVEIRETRDIVAREDGIDRYVVSRTLYWPNTEVTTEATEGAFLERSHWPHDRYMLHLVRFPRPLRAGEGRRFVVTHRTKQMAPIYTTNAKETRKLTVRLQFRNVAPGAVWLIERLPSELLRTEGLHDVLRLHAPVVVPDDYGYLEHDFELEEHASSGLSWELIDGRADRLPPAPASRKDQDS